MSTANTPRDWRREVRAGYMPQEDAVWISEGAHKRHLSVEQAGAIVWALLDAFSRREEHRAKNPPTTKP